MPWIETIGCDDATGRLEKLYDRVKGPGDTIDNIMMIHSLRPHTMEGHMALYKNVLHHSGNTVEKWFLEVLGLWVSTLNACDYCVEHHFAGLVRLLGDTGRSTAIRAAIEAGDIAPAPLDAAQKLAMRYAELLTRDPGTMTEDSITALRTAGYSDGEILEINQVVAYFNYANRTALGLGCTTEGDILGLSPNDSADPGNWMHS